MARIKFEEELRSGRKYNNKMLDEHKARIAQDECKIMDESAKKRLQKVNLG